jgi:Abnormal spindle-like microcephaly-assoc'd, ASPM-SPD-2-Hydin
MAALTFDVDAGCAFVEQSAARGSLQTHSAKHPQTAHPGRLVIGACLITVTRAGWQYPLTKWQGELMRGLMRRVAVVAGGVVVLGGVAGMAAGAASAKADPPVLAFSQSSHGYGSVTVGKKVSQVFTLTNSGGTASRALTLSLSGPGAFSISSDRCQGRSLGPGKSCTVAVKFAPAGAGPVTATLTATGVKRPAAATASLSGTGVVPGHLYWVSKNERGDLIYDAGLDGSNPQTLVSALRIDGLAVSGSHMYWNE